MDIGMTLPGRGPLAEPESLGQLARRADELGFAYLAVPDHIVVPRTIDSRYPYSATGAFPGSASGSCLCLLYTSPSPRDQRGSRMPSSA